LAKAFQGRCFVNTNQILSAVVPIFAVMTVASIVEMLLPFRKQSRFAHRRASTNLSLIAINIGTGLLLNGILLAGSVWFVAQGWGLLQLLNLAGALAMLLTVIVLDLAAYAAHVALHKFAWLWRIHLVHHTDVAVDATTWYRHHPIEPVFRWVVTATAAFALGASPAGLALSRSLSALNAIIEHSNIRTPRWLDRVLVLIWVTPDMHKIHHSRVQSQTDSNYSNLFSFFDRLFGTFTPTRFAADVTYGIDGFDHPQHQSFKALLSLPFGKLGRVVTSDVNTSVGRDVTGEQGTRLCKTQVSAST
jgi:sterol desaturase/sphingolipid hydroxylase (fatty acid hydroxylase superfamily)